MHVGLQVRLIQPKLVPEKLGEEMVVAVPLAPVVEGHQEQIRCLDLAQDLRRAVGLGHRIAKRSVEPVEKRCDQQELAQLVGLPTQHLCREVVDQVSVVSGEVLDELLLVSAPSQR